MKPSFLARLARWGLGILLAVSGPWAWAQPVYGAVTTCTYGNETRSYTAAGASSYCSGADQYGTPNRTIDSAYAAAYSGTLHATTSGQGSASGAQAFAQYYDDVRPLVFGMNGQAGTVSVTTYYEGGSFEPGTIGFMRLVDTVGREAAHQDFTGQILFISGKSTEIVPVVFGQTFGLGSLLQIQLQSAGSISFADTAEVIGFQAYDSQGNPVAASFVDDAGVDWGAFAATNAATLISAVPEPGTLPLLAAGLAALGLAIRRRASGHARR